MKVNVKLESDKGKSFAFTIDYRLEYMLLSVSYILVVVNFLFNL